MGYSLEGEVGSREGFNNSMFVSDGDGTNPVEKKIADSGQKRDSCRSLGFE